MRHVGVASIKPHGKFTRRSGAVSRDRQRLILCALVLSIASLLFQAFPASLDVLLGLTLSALKCCDLRAWTWRGYAVLFGFITAALFIAKIRQDSSSS